MTWDHRVVHSISGGEDIYAIHEAHYKDGQVVAHTENPVPVQAESIDGLRWVLTGMLLALDKEVLEAKE